MILSHIKELQSFGIPYAQDIANFIQTNDCLNLPNEEILIKGQDLFVKVMEYIPKPQDQNKFETHQCYADVQYVVRGVELMQVAPSDQLQTLTEYDKVGDYQFYTAKGYVSDLVVRAEEFTVFYPGQAHRPSCLYKDHRSPVKKLVFKIRIF